ncbi:hypothetical protein [Bradyrhizobium sp. NBAIM01]|uniref:hypothetical protein n=1 Tax=Bradyrhizobium sp. NBAIM01 TaxID=2793818 RepID=UPI001CD2B3C5|nr:hypothetical protein [Bradyrhizobium sp. NBAIM01]MCA1516362.1 hypothetical protein [Bradyrhizobium sp. NBAIM01]
MPTFRTAVLDSENDVERRLQDWGLTREQFIEIAKMATSWADDASPLMPLNAPGTLAYIFGVQELRRQLIGGGWHPDRTGNVEAVINRSLGLRIGFHNVDRACDTIFPPHPRSAKGSASENLCGPNLFQHFGVEPGPLTAVSDDGTATYYVMVGEDGSVELSHPVILDGTYRHFHERIFVFRPSGTWESEMDPETGPIEDFDVEVSFKE